MRALFPRVRTDYNYWLQLITHWMFARYSHSLWYYLLHSTRATRGTVILIRHTFSSSASIRFHYPSKLVYICSISPLCSLILLIEILTTYTLAFWEQYITNVLHIRWCFEGLYVSEIADSFHLSVKVLVTTIFFICTLARSLQCDSFQSGIFH